MEVMWLSLLLGWEATPKILNGIDNYEGIEAVGLLYDPIIRVLTPEGEYTGIGRATSILIAPDTIITTGHSLSSQFTQTDVSYSWSNPSSLQADDGVPWTTVREFIVHPEFSREKGVAVTEFDIAIAFLEEPVDVTPLNLATAALTESYANDIAGIAGYGPYFRPHSDFESEDCPYAIEEAIDANGDFVFTCGSEHRRFGQVAYQKLRCDQITVREDEQMYCIGDSGGPLLSLPGMEVLGLISSGNHQCTRGNITRIDQHLEWIDAEMRQACEDGRRSWCDEPGLAIADLTPPTDQCCTCQNTNPVYPGLYSMFIALFATIRRRL